MTVPAPTAGLKAPKALPRRFEARLIAWEGRFSVREGRQKTIALYDSQLKSSITKAVKGTDWRYRNWKIYESEASGTVKFEVRLANAIRS
jgi:hypothetical protein